LPLTNANEANLVKLTTRKNKLECFPPKNICQALHLIKPMWSTSQSQTPTLNLPSNVSLGWKYLPGTNTLAYFAKKAKKFYEIGSSTTKDDKRLKHNEPFVIDLLYKTFSALIITTFQ
jgi:hypothetical protein